jgi:tetratricopeptide (TPR) repeat protein
LESQPKHSITLPLVYKNEENICLPLVINVLAKYWGEEIPLQEAAVRARKYPQIRGSIMIEGIELAEKHGISSYIYKGSIKDLKKKIDQGIPPIVILPGIHEIVQHATIVCGYNLEESRILTYVPEPDTIGAIPETKFEYEWEQDDRTTLILIPHDMKDLVTKEDLLFNDSNRICFEAEKLRYQNKTNNAIEKLRSATEMEPENPQTWCMLAGLYNELNLDEAESCYRRAISINPKYYMAYRGIGNYLLKKKDYSLAEQYYTNAININPYRFGPIYKNRAIARLQLSNISAAKEDLAKYLEQTPNATDKKDVEETLRQL